MDDSGSTDARVYEPTFWFVVFHPKSSRWWVNWLAFGRFRHVSAFGYVPHARVWLFFEVLGGRTRVYAVPDGHADWYLANAAEGTVVVRMPGVDAADLSFKIKAGFWCVPAVAHLVGLRSCALRPDRLYRQCLAIGGEVWTGDNGLQGSRTGAPEGNLAA